MEAGCGVGRGVSLQLLRLSSLRQATWEGAGMAEGVGVLPCSTSGPSPGNPNGGICWDPFSPYKDTPLSRLTAHLGEGELRVVR